MAVALILMTGAGLLIESFFVDANQSGLFFREPYDVPAESAADHYATPESQSLFYRELLERLKSVLVSKPRALPTTCAGRPCTLRLFLPRGTVCQGIGKDPTTALAAGQRGLFATVRTADSERAAFLLSATLPPPRRVVVNQTIADRYWPGQNPVGKRLANSRDMNSA